MTDDQWKAFQATLPAIIRQVFETERETDPNAALALAAGASAAYSIGPGCQEALVPYMAGARKCFEDAGVDLSPATGREDHEPDDVMFGHIASLYGLINDHVLSCVVPAASATLDLCEAEDLPPAFGYEHVARASERQVHRFLCDVVPKMTEQIVYLEYTRLGVEFLLEQCSRTDAVKKLYHLHSQRLAADVADAVVEALDKGSEIQEAEAGKSGGGGRTIH